MILLRLFVLFAMLFSGLCLNANPGDPDSIRIYIFLSPDCPISQRSVPVLNDLYSKYKEVISFECVIPFRTDSNTTTQFSNDYSIPYTVTSDTGCRLSAKYRIKVVPTVVLLAGDSVYYQGAIDNTFIAVGQKNGSTIAPYLEAAIQSVLQRKKVTKTLTDPVGCLVHCDL